MNAHINFNQSCEEDGGGEMELIREIGKYLTSKVVAINAILKALKGTESQCTNKNQEILSMVSTLREAELVTLSVLETLLPFIAGPKLRSKSNSWWFVPNWCTQKRMVCEDAKTNTNELEKAHVELQFLIVHITRKSDCAVHLENIQNLLEKSESSI